MSRNIFTRLPHIRHDLLPKDRYHFGIPIPFRVCLSQRISRHSIGIRSIRWHFYFWIIKVIYRQSSWKALCFCMYCSRNGQCICCVVIRASAAWGRCWRQWHSVFRDRWQYAPSTLWSSITWHGSLCF